MEIKAKLWTKPYLVALIATVSGGMTPDGLGK